ncbi:LacI family DNA-binding transcriptional regulator [Gorillibacterium massiliense]|uniref:LacI family DNA-binding transcriptional regulator n=1 Tax=Gorillibacterium massiliense TaxID=1280390 RepID=UPI0004AFDAB1|nr:LacI family DNA-binding transcriptional regulator [Gorillibacterium massiliense]
MKTTIKDLARELGLAVSTVSRALNGSYGVHPETIERVRQKAMELGYIPNMGAQQLVGKSSKLIGVFIPEFEFEATPEFMEFFPLLHQALRSFGKDAILFSIPYPGDTGKTGSRLNEWIVMRNLEGCLFLPPFSTNHPLIRDALELNIPCVNFADALGPRCSIVNSDDREGGRMAARYLAEKGHRTIGYINGPGHLHICRERYAGFCEGLAEFGIAHSPDQAAEGDFSGTSGGKAAHMLQSTVDGMTAVFCANDLMAMGAMSAFAQEERRVPQDLSVIGYDGTFFTAYVYPPLTTIRHPYERLSTKAVELLMELLNGGTGRRVVIPPAIMERMSVSQRELGM